MNGQACRGGHGFSAAPSDSVPVQNPRNVTIRPTVLVCLGSRSLGFESEEGAGWGREAFAPSADTDLSYFSKAVGSCSLWFVQTLAHFLRPCTSLSVSLKYREEGH